MDYIDYFSNTLLEAVDYDSTIIRDELYPKISAVLSTPAGDKKFKQLVGSFIDKNSAKLRTAGPQYLITFGDIDKAQHFNLFKITETEVVGLIKKITDQISKTTDFKLLHQNPIYTVFYCCVRYYTLKKDQKGINTALAIYALANYPLVFKTFFKYEPNESVMQYTMDNLSEKFLMKQAGNLFDGLMRSIQHSYDFLGPYMKEGKDKEVVRFIQRIRNDQKSMIKNICDQYMKNHRQGNRVKLTKDASDDIQVDVDTINNTSQVEIIADNIVNQIITNGLDMKRVSYAKEIGDVGLSDARLYLSKIITTDYTKDIRAFIHSILFLYLYDEHKTKQDINSTEFIGWSTKLFKKTNSNNANIKCIKETLDKWAEEVGVHAKYKREGSRINYKKTIFWYFILSIQYYNK